MNTIIEQIKAKIERRMQRFESHIEEYKDTPFTRIVDVNKIRLDECTQILRNIDTLQEQPVKDNALFNSCLAKVNPKTRDEVRMKIDKMIEQPVCDDLEEASSKFATHTAANGVSVEFLHEKLAFQEGANWQKERYSNMIINTPEQFEDWGMKNFEAGVKIGMARQKEQMMKEAVEGRITQDSDTKLIVISEPIEGFKFGDKGKLLFVKED